MSQYSANDSRLIADALREELETLQKAVHELFKAGGTSDSQVQLLRGLISLSYYAVQESSQQQYLQSELTENLDSVYRELEYVKTSNVAYEKQMRWLKDQVILSRKTVGKLKIRAILRQTLETSLEITYAETGSIFLLGHDNVIVDYLLMHQHTTEDERRDLIGKVLKKGLAGWVAQNLMVGLVTNTAKDERWLTLPEQPYQVGSALCVPIIRGKELVGIITLTHSEPEHFTQQDCDLVETSAYQAALLIENDRLEARNQQLLQQNQIHEEFFRNLLSTPSVGAFMFQGNKFIQVNTRCAALFGYSRDELIRLPSIASLIAYEDRENVQQVLQQCQAKNPPNLNLEFHISRKNGQVVKVLAQGLATQFKSRAAIVGLLDQI